LRDVLARFESRGTSPVRVFFRPEDRATVEAIA
jgi:hypothetical protein